MAKRALITGVTGQDGAYLARLLLDKGYETYALVARRASDTFWRLRELSIFDQVRLEFGDLTDLSSLTRIIGRVDPDEVYNLGAQSFVGGSWDQPILTAEVSGIGTLKVLEALRLTDSDARLYQASTSEMYGGLQDSAQNEETPFHPRSPYGVAKLFAHWAVVNYRESFGRFASCGILFNHESPLRGLEFVTRKITHTLARIRSGEDIILELGNLEAKRDWGFAGDFVEGMWSMLQQDDPDDFVLATGRTHTVRAFVDAAAQCCGFDLEWEGEGRETSGRDRTSGRTLVGINPEYFRPAEVDVLVGDASKAREQLGWEPKVTFEGLVEMMTTADIDRQDAK